MASELRLLALNSYFVGFRKVIFFYRHFIYTRVVSVAAGRWVTLKDSSLSGWQFLH